MTTIIPAILPQTYRGIELAVEKVVGAAPIIQIDFVDGHFVPNRTWWFNNKDEEKLQAILDEDMGLPYWDSQNYEFDLMVKDPLQYIDTFFALGPASIIFHAEGLDTDSMLNFFETLPDIIKSAIAFGMAIGVDTDPAILAPYIPYITSIQCMGIKNVGYQNQTFDERVIKQIQSVRALYPDKIIAVDGGVSVENAALLVEAGASILVVGSALFQNTDPRGTIETFKTICKKAHIQSESSN